MKKLSLDLMFNIPDKSHEESSDNKARLECAKHVLHEIIKDNLTGRQKQVLILYFFENKNTVEIAEMLNVNKSTVSRTLKRALDNIKKYIRYYKFR